MSLMKTNIFQKIKIVGKILQSRYTHYLTNRQNYQSVKFIEYKGLKYDVDDMILCNCNVADCIVEIFLNHEEEKVVLITEKFHLEYVPHLRSYEVKESMNIIVAEDIDSFEYPPVNKHIYYGNYYIRTRTL